MTFWAAHNIVIWILIKEKYILNCFFSFLGYGTGLYWFVYCKKRAYTCRYTYAYITNVIDSQCEGENIKKLEEEEKEIKARF